MLELLVEIVAKEEEELLTTLELITDAGVVVEIGCTVTGVA